MTKWDTKQRFILKLSGQKERYINDIGIYHIYFDFD